MGLSDKGIDVDCFSSLPGRQLRNLTARLPGFLPRSLPGRQLRNTATPTRASVFCSLPGRQLRNLA
ncbi:hypothetical protein B1023_07340 [Enterobacter hormaechei]|nr:hypothetical protein B1023_07340 [Enterobacter hormaechei]